MQLLGHFDNSQIDEDIAKLNKATDTLNDLQEEYSGNAYMENFVKNYMSTDNIEQTDSIEYKTEEYEDNFNLDLASYLNNDDSYFYSDDEKNNETITPNVVIDDLKEESTQEKQHIEWIDDISNESNSLDEIYTEESTTETIEDSITPTYVSFGEEIKRNSVEDDTAYSYLDSTFENDEQNNDFDSLYSPYSQTIDDTIENDELYNTNESQKNFEFEEKVETTEEYPPLFENQNIDYDESLIETKQETQQTYEVLQAGFTDNASKEKINELTTYAKESSINDKKIIEEIMFDTTDFVERNKVFKNYDKLIADFEKEGLNVRVHKKLVKEAKESRTYVQTNKIKMTRNWISFCFISALLAICYACMLSSGIDYYGFSHKIFVIGILVALIIPIISTIIFAINPYKKHLAGFSPSVSFMLSALIFIQLLLIIYCFNLQLGFYSFTQNHYNHLYWIVPAIISLYPILNSIVYTTLYRSKNFHS